MGMGKIDEMGKIWVNGKDKIKDKLHSQLTNTSYKNINTSNYESYDKKDSYLNLIQKVKKKKYVINY